jgi:hypothetical protein
MFLVGYSHPEPFPQAYDLTGSVSPRRLFVTFGSAFLLTASLEYGGIQIQAEAFFWRLKQRQKPTP